MVSPIVTINYLAVLAATLASMFIGFLWYGPIFGKTWMKLMNFDKKKMDDAKKKGMAKTYFVMILFSFITSYVLAHFVDYVGATTIGSGIQLAFWLWLGFIVPVLLGSVLWEGKPVKLYFINVFHYLVSFIVMTTILVLWI